VAELKRVILLLESSREFGRELLFGIARYARLYGPWSFYREPSDLRPAIPQLARWGANGIIMRNSVIRKEVLTLRLPTILALHGPGRPDYIPAITTNDKAITALVGEHLLSRGLRNYAFCGFAGLAWSDHREYYFRRFAESAGFPLHVYPHGDGTHPTSWFVERGRMERWIRILPTPIGIMAANDDRGQHVLEACKAAGVRVPEDIAVIGVDNDPVVCDLCDPPLTSVALNAEAAGFAAARLLDALMRGASMHGQEIEVRPTHVVPRQSTDLLAVDDDDVAAAIRFIRENARRRLRVDDVARNTSLGRRSLEMHFRNTIHRSIQDEIRRVQTESIVQMLVSTDMSISEIADHFSFTDAMHISRYFAREKGMGLKEFRKLIRKS
jgi:LacI family transcriptional regulator